MGLHENILKEPVARLPLREAIVVEPATTIRQAIKAMQAKHLGCVIVTGEDGRPTGTFTEEVLIYLLAKDPSSLDDRVDAHLSDEWACVQQTDPIADMLKAMQSKRLRFICVTDESGRAAALTGQKGLMEYIAEHFPRQVMVQRVGIKPYNDQREGA